MVEDQIQDLDSATCGLFQIYFYENLFNPKIDSSIRNDTKLKKYCRKAVKWTIFTRTKQKRTKNGGVCWQNRCKNIWIKKYFFACNCKNYITKEFKF